jgi:hypothetical protein
VIDCCVQPPFTALAVRNAVAFPVFELVYD